MPKSNSPSVVNSTTARIRKIALSAMLIASQVVLARFLSIQTPILTISFSFLPIYLAGLILGWKGASLVALISDLIGALLFPVGSFFFGYTLTTTLTGLAAGLTLYRRQGIKVDRRFLLRLLLCVMIVTGLLNGGLNTVWIMITTGGASQVIVPVRIAKQLIMAPIQFLTTSAIAKAFAKRFNQLFFAHPANQVSEVANPQSEADLSCA